MYVLIGRISNMRTISLKKSRLYLHYLEYIEPIDYASLRQVSSDGKSRDKK